MLTTNQRIAMDARLFRQGAAGHAGAIECCAQPHDCFANHASHKSISPYALQEQKHISICGTQFISRRMEKTPDERREILRKFIVDNGLKIARWCKESAVDKNSVYNFLNSHSQSLDMRTYAKLARTAGVPVWRIAGEAPEPPSPTSIWVVGHVQAGDFREAIEWEDSNWYAVDVPVPVRFKGKSKALEVRGSSMNVDYPEGSIAIYVDMLDFRPPRHGDDVLVYSYRHDDTIETTLKEYREIDGRWLWPRSHDPLHQAPINLESPGDDIKEIVVRGIVIGSYRPRNH